MRIARRIVAMLLALAILSLTLASCNRSYDEAEVIAAATELITASEVINEIYYGDGIKYLENSDRNNGIYCEADPYDLEMYGFSTIAQLKEMTMTVFSKAHAERMFAGAFYGSFMQDGSSTKARYYQKYVESDNAAQRETPECIMVCSKMEKLLKGDARYSLSEMTVKGSVGDIVYVLVPVTVSYEGKTQKQTLEIGLFEEEYGWRLETPTYATYNEFQDIYDELQKN